MTPSPKLAFTKEWMLCPANEPRAFPRPQPRCAPDPPRSPPCLGTQPWGSLGRGLTAGCPEPVTTRPALPRRVSPGLCCGCPGNAPSLGGVGGRAGQGRRADAAGRWVGGDFPRRGPPCPSPSVPSPHSQAREHPVWAPVGLGGCIPAKACPTAARTSVCALSCRGVLAGPRELPTPAALGRPCGGGSSALAPDAWSVCAPPRPGQGWAGLLF